MHNVRRGAFGVEAELVSDFSKEPNVVAFNVPYVQVVVRASAQRFQRLNILFDLWIITHTHPSFVLSVVLSALKLRFFVWLFVMPNGIIPLFSLDCKAFGGFFTNSLGTNEGFWCVF